MQIISNITVRDSFSDWSESQFLLVLIFEPTRSVQDKIVRIIRFFGRYINLCYKKRILSTPYKIESILVTVCLKEVIDTYKT